MLTESEREWLRNRKGKNDLYFFCKYCTVPKEDDDCYWSHIIEACPVYPDIEDAAEFSERVAAKLARWDNEYHKDDHLCPYGDDDLDSYIPLCHCIVFCQDHPKLGCIAAKLAWARMAVEEEMDNEP